MRGDFIMNNAKQTTKFGLLTTTSMIIGIVIGSGIFFKTPEIIVATDGNILMGALAFCIAAISIIFGGLTIAQYSAINNKAGGLITYGEMGYGKTMGYLIGWFQTMLYFPALVAVISWVSACYTLGLFGMDNLLTTGQFSNTVWVVAVLNILVLFTLNTFKTKLAGKFQNFSMFIKVSALIILSIIALVFGNPGSIVSNFSAYPTSQSGLFVALVSVVFAFDGWIVAPAIAHEIKDSKKNLTKALILAPLAIAIIYLLYYLGLSSFQSVDIILAGQDPLGQLALSLFGDIGMRIVYLVVVCSILGTLNGLILGYIRLPYSLAYRNELPFSKHLSQVNQKYDIPFNSSIFACVMCLILLALHFCSIDGAILYGMGLFDGMEIDNLPIIANYLFLILLYLPVLFKKIKADNFINQHVYPFIAVCGASIVIFAGFSKPKFNVYLIISILIILAGLLIRPKKCD